MPHRLDWQIPLDRSLRQLLQSRLTGLTTRGANVVFENRKILKRTRALLRLAATADNHPQLRATDQALRSAAHQLSTARDHEARLAAIGYLDTEKILPRSTAASLRRAVAAPAKTAAAKLSAAEIASLQKRIKRLPLRTVSTASVLAAAVATYRAARRMMQRCAHDPTAEAFHDWRKEVQRHRRHMQALATLWPDAISVQAAAAHRLATILGTDHDLALLADWLNAPEAPKSVERHKRATTAATANRQAHLRRDAIRLGVLLFAEKPKAFGLRLKRYSMVQQRDGFDPTRGKSKAQSGR